MKNFTKTILWVLMIACLPITAKAAISETPVTASTVKDMLEAIRYESRVELCQEGVN